MLEKHEFRDTIEWLKKLGFVGIESEYSWTGSNEHLIVGIFMGNIDEMFKNKLFIDQKVNFDKWRKAYYVREIPLTKSTRKVVERHMKDILSDFHIERSKHLEYFFPEEEWSHD